MTFLETATLSIAAYAAIVATGALTLEVRRWFESRPKLVINLTPEGMIISDDPETDEKDLCIVKVTNRGREATTIINLLLFEFPNWVRRLFNTPAKTYVIPNPQLKGHPLSIPSEIAPNKQWMGVIRKRADIIPDLQSGAFYVGVATTHSDRIQFKHIQRRRKPLPKGTKEL